MTTLLQNGLIITKDVQDTVIDNGWIYIKESYIEMIGVGKPTLSILENSSKVIDLNGSIVLPGLINCHTHFSQSLLKVNSENLGLEDWLGKIIRPFQNKIDIDMFNLSLTVGIVENITCGVTTVVQHLKLKDIEFTESLLDVCKNMDIRLSLMIACNDEIIEYHGGIKNFFDYVIRIKLAKENDKLTIGIGPTSLGKCSTTLLKQLAILSEDTGMPIHIHTSETQNERNNCILKHNMPPITWLNFLGVLGEHTQLVHSIWIDDEEINMIREKGCTIVHCPISNLFLRSGVAPINKILMNDIPVTIGCDGNASGISQNVLDNVKLAALIHKSPTSPYTSASKILDMVTRNAATMLNRVDLGQLKPKAKADIVVVNTNNIKHQPLFDAQATVVFNTTPNDILMVFINGELVLENNKIFKLDQNQILFRIKEKFGINNLSKEIFKD